MEQRARHEVRCAIYTRKSTEEGLEKEFNSLDAQREACAAYVASQRHEGWTLNPDVYDDGGYSGGSTERPAFKRLMADVAARKVDIIVVYKVDRLTRSLSDFAKIVDILDAAGSSFVSITQSFNTTTSMGRLTLNVLLSFAQFEREVISERVRDKVAASKKKGMWMGGSVPLGYDAINRKLVVNEIEALMVRHIMDSYLRLGTVPRLVECLASEGIVNKIRDRGHGLTSGGTPYQRGALYSMLSNQLYRGKTKHKGEVYDGEHEEIVTEEIWNGVQAQLSLNGLTKCSSIHRSETSPFAGLISDDFGRRMKPADSRKEAIRYRYYASVEDALAETEHKGKPIRRISAGDLETVVVQSLTDLLSDPSRIRKHFELAYCSWNAIEALETIGCFRAELGEMTICQVGQFSRQIGLQIMVGKSEATATFSAVQFARRVGLPASIPDKERVSLFVSLKIERRSHRNRLGVEMGADNRPVKRDGGLVALILKAHFAKKQLVDSEQVRCPSYSDRHVARMARLAFLAPDITSSILNGTQPIALTARQLLRAPEIPLAWAAQRRMFGYC